VLTYARQADERKREAFYKFYEDTEGWLKDMDDKICHLFGKNLKDRIAWHKRSLKQKECILLVAGGLGRIYMY